MVLIIFNILLPRLFIKAPKGLVNLMWTFWTATPCTKYMKVPSIEAKRTKKLHKRSTGSFHSDSLHWWNSYEPFLFICRNELNSAKETKFNLTLLLQMNFEKYSINQCLLLVASVFFFFSVSGSSFSFCLFSPDDILLSLHKTWPGLHKYLFIFLQQRHLTTICFSLFPKMKSKN